MPIGDQHERHPEPEAVRGRQRRPAAGRRAVERESLHGGQRRAEARGPADRRTAPRAAARRRARGAGNQRHLPLPVGDHEAGERRPRTPAPSRSSRRRAPARCPARGGAAPCPVTRRRRRSATKTTVKPRTKSSGTRHRPGCAGGLRRTAAATRTRVSPSRDLVASRSSRACPTPLGQLRPGQPGDVGEVARHQRQDARRGERQRARPAPRPATASSSGPSVTNVPALTLGRDLEHRPTAGPSGVTPPRKRAAIRPCRSMMNVYGGPQQLANAAAMRRPRRRCSGR